ncbi:MAG TPA: hypothetical protein VF988_09480, partial [Verrucomicrobiae bacterium]
ERTNALTRLEQMEVQELQRQEQRVAEAFHAWLLELPELLAQVPPDADYDALRADVKKFLQAVADAKIEDELNGAVKTLEEPDTATGHALAQSAAEKMDRLIGRCNGFPKQASQCLTARFQPKLSKPGLGNTIQQILAALNVGSGQGGRDGYGMFNEDVAVYGPNIQLAGEQAGGRGDTGGQAATPAQVVAGAAPDTEPAPAQPQGRVKLQPDAKFPLRYRELVGEYFRVMAEAGKESNK